MRVAGGARIALFSGLVYSLIGTQPAGSTGRARDRIPDLGMPILTAGTSSTVTVARTLEGGMRASRPLTQQPSEPVEPTVTASRGVLHRLVIISPVPA